MAGDESVEIIRHALEKAIASYREALGRKPSREELERFFRIALEAAGQGEGLESENRAPVRPRGGPRALRIENAKRRRLDEEKSGIRKIMSIEEARQIAVEMVHSPAQYRIPSCEMQVVREGGRVSLREEQFLSDGTKILGRSYTYDSDEEAVESIACILWETGRTEGRAIILRNMRNGVH